MVEVIEQKHPLVGQVFEANIQILLGTCIGMVTVDVDQIELHGVCGIRPEFRQCLMGVAFDQGGYSIDAQHSQLLEYKCGTPIPGGYSFLRYGTIIRGPEVEPIDFGVGRLAHDLGHGPAAPHTDFEVILRFEVPGVPV